MNKYIMVLQICAILFICLILYFLFKIICTMLKKYRLNYFSLDIKKNKYKEEKFILKIIYRFSDILESLIIFNSLAKTYNKFSFYDKRFRNGMDFISLKLLFGFLLILLYLFMTLLYVNEIDSLLILVCFILGFVLLDFYCVFISNKVNENFDMKLIPAFSTLFNSINAGRSIEQALMDVIQRSEDLLNREFKMVLNDIRIGISIGDAFKRMYDRTNIGLVRYISNVLLLANKNGIPISECYDVIQVRLLELEKNKTELSVFIDINRIAWTLFMILPVIFLVLMIIFNPSYYKLAFSVNGNVILLIIGIVYALYAFIISDIVWRNKKDE